MPGMQELIIILIIVILIFGGKRLKNIGSDLGGAIKGFKKSIDDSGSEKAESNDDVIESDLEEETEKKEEEDNK